MPQFITRNLLACVLPTVIAVLSVYWFRKKRKLKENSDSSPSLRPSLQEECQNTNEMNSLPKVEHEEKSKSCFDVNIDKLEAVDSLCDLKDKNSDLFIDSVSNSSSENVDCSSLEFKCNGFISHQSKNSTKHLLPHTSSPNTSVKPSLNVSKDFTDSFLETPLTIIYDSKTDTNLSESSNDVDIQQEHRFKNFKPGDVSLDNHSFTRTVYSRDSTKDLHSGDTLQTTSSPLSNPSDCDAFCSIGTSSVSLNDLTSNSSLNSPPELSSSILADTVIGDEELSVDSGKGSTRGSISRSSENHELDNQSGIKQLVDTLLQSSPNGEVFMNSTGESIKTNNLSHPSQSSSSSNFELNPSPCQYPSDTLNEVGNTTSKSNSNFLDSMNYDTSSKYIYEFELPSELCGRLIGRQGKHVKFIKEQTNATVCIKRHPFNDALKLISVEGARADVNFALDCIRKRYPISQFPSVTLVQTNTPIDALNIPEPLQLHLPEGVSVDVILSSMVTAGHFFLQQPTHPSYPSLAALDQCMMTCYSQAETPTLPSPVAGIICAATIMGGWFRAQVTCVFDGGDQCEIKYLDYGGYSQLPLSSLRQIRSDFMSLPFQASECYLANVEPINAEVGWTPEASAVFEELAQGQILQAMVVYFHEDGTPCVHLYRVQGITSMFINRELVTRGHAKWVEHH